MRNIVVLAVALAANMHAASPAAPTARLVFANGPVAVISAGRLRAARAGERLLDGDFVKTGPNTTAIVQLPDGSRLKLRAGTSLKLDLSDQPAGMMGATLSAGSVFAQIAKGGVSPHFQITTEHAVVSVSGTEFFTAYGRPGKGGADLWVCVGSGAVAVKADRSMAVREGEGVLLPGGSRVTKSQRYAWTRTLNWNMDEEKGEVVDGTKLDAAYSDLRDQDYR